MDRQYVIRIENATAQSSKSPIAGDTSESDTQKSKGLLSKDAAKAFVGGMVAYKTVKSFASQVISHNVSMVQLRTGSNELQQRANFQLQVGQRALSMLETGLMAGLVTGNVVGFLAGVTISGAQQLIQWGQNQNRIDTQRALENQTIQRNYIRAGAHGSRYGI